MAKTNNVIELNGKKYDALTGALLDISAKPSHSTYVKPMPVHPKPPHRGSVDGMVSTTEVIVALKKTPTVARKAAPVAHHKPEHSKTLMRHAVKAPVIAPKASAKATSPLQKAVPAKLAVKPKHSSEVIDPDRTKRASSVSRSQAIRRFNNIDVAPARPQTTTTAQPPAAPAKPLTTPPIIHHQKQTQVPQASAAPQPRVNQRGSLDIRRSAQRPQAAQRHTVQPQSKAMFEQALASASSHEQPAPKERASAKVRRGARKRRKALSIAAAIAVFVLLAGFVAYQSRASIQLQLASAKAGFSIATPQYKPSGFALGKVSYSPGTASLAYSNGTKQFDVTQKQSNWDSQTLLDNYVATAGKSYQGFQANGRTVYIYGDGNATWVNGGIWYQIHADSSLSSDQLVKIAASM